MYNNAMPRPKTKSELLEFSESNYQNLLELINPIPLEVLSQAGACEHWSCKDILAHLHAWHKLYLTWYEEGMAGGKPEMPASGYTWKTTPELNEKIFEQYKDMELDMILDLLEGTHQEVMAIINNHTDAELFTKKLYDWTGSTSLGSYTISATSSHYDWAIKHIKKFLKSKD